MSQSAKLPVQPEGYCTKWKALEWRTLGVGPVLSLDLAQTLLLSRLEADEATTLLPLTVPQGAGRKVEQDV